MRLFVGGRADLLGELVNLGDHVGDLLQGRVQLAAEFEAFVDDGRAAVHVFDRFTRFFLNALNELGDFFRGLRRLLRQFADFVSDNGKSQAVFARARRFDRGIEREQVGLFGQIVDDFDDLADIIGPLAKYVDDFARALNRRIDTVQAVGSFLHGPDTAVNFLAG